MLLKLLAAFIVIPLVELYLLFRIAEFTSPLATLALVIVTGVIGSFLARREGAMAWFRFQSALGEGRMPSREIQDGLMIVFAAALLLTPGLLTDVVGFTLLIPWGRALVRRFVLKPYVSQFNVQVVSSETLHRERRHDSGTIDAKVVQRK
tara:strand:+ start:356643 stop:357092 length:450 start_codon:yes stop_codon:yes gene_type:complete